MMLRRPLVLGLLALAASSLVGCSSCSDEKPGAAASGSATPVSAASVSATPAKASPAASVSASPATPVSAKADALAGPFNVLLLTIDSLRADMPWAGYPRPIAPRLSELHARSVVYDNAYATSSFTSKSIPGLLTGRSPSELTRTGAFFTKYLDPDQFACTHLAKQGIPCVGGHAHAYFGKGQSGFETGFSDWKIVPGITFDYQKDPYVTSDKLTPLAIEMLGKVAETSAGKPFFAWFHYMDPHDEYKAHPESPKFGAKPRDLYDEEVFFTDLWIGKLLDWVSQQPWSKATAIILTADHGEAFGEHGATRHAHELWEELVHVPLFLAIPGVAPRKIAARRGHADVMPTIADLLGAKDMPALPGKSLLAEARGGEAEARDVVCDLPEDDYNERRRALIYGDAKLLSFGNDQRFALFDLAADPKESDDLIAKDKERAAAMRARYKELGKRLVDVPPRGGIPKHAK